MMHRLVNDLTKYNEKSYIQTVTVVKCAASNFLIYI